MIFSAAVFIPALLIASATSPQLFDMANERPERWHRVCRVEKQMMHGTLVLIRDFTDDGKFESGDFALWHRAGDDPSNPQRPIDWDWDYYWRGQNDFTVKSREIDLTIRIALDVAMPNAALLRIHRPFPVLPGGVIDGAGLITEVFGNGARDPGSGRSSIPLGDLLAYAEGFDRLDWTLTNYSEATGFGTPIEVGILDVRGFREGLAKLPKLKRQLNAKSLDVRKNCTRETQTPMILYDHEWNHPAPAIPPQN